RSGGACEEITMNWRSLASVLGCVALTACGGGKPAPAPPLDANAQFAAAEHEYVVYFMQQFPVVATYLGGSAFDPQLADIDGKLRNDSFAALNIEDVHLSEFRDRFKKLDPAQ